MISMFYLGIDVSKAKLDCCLLVDADTLKRKTKTVDNSSSGVANLLAWLAKQGLDSSVIHAIAEGTGVYHETACQALADAGVTVSIANPAQVKDFGKGLAVRTKNDAMDSFVLARYGALVKPAIWTPPAPEARALQALLARREALAKDLQRELNRQEKADVAKVPRLVRDSIGDAIKFLKKQLTKLEKEIDDHINSHPKLKDDLTLLQSIPGVGQKVGNSMLSVMHNHQFQSAEQLAAYLGLVPIEHQSGSSVRGKARLSKAGPAKVRATLYMAAVASTQHNPHIKALYQRLLARGKAKMAAIGAAMRKLVHLCFGVLKTRQPYAPCYGQEG
jgi:transposase